MTERSVPPVDVELPEPDPELVASRARLLPEEREAGSDDPIGEATAVLAESELRTVEVADQADDDGDLDVVVLEVERRTSAETVAPPGT